MAPSRPYWIALVAGSSLFAACIFQRLAVESHPVALHQSPRTIRGSVKAHLVDGSTILFRDSVVLRSDTLRGTGERFDLRLQSRGLATAIELDSVVALESFNTKVRPAETFFASAAGVILAGAAIGGIAVAIACAMDPKCFGSCPTAYSDSAGAPVLEAEGFSFSIAPLFEFRDVDRLHARPDSDGILRLEIRNEALETHFINHVELLAVDHAPEEVAVPDPRGAPLVIRDLTPPSSAVDRAGRDVRALLEAHDGRFFTTDSTTLWRATSTDYLDFIDLTFSAPGLDSVAVYFRMRNSLLNTTLLYDLMLGDRGTHAFDWMADTLGSISGAVSLGQWAMGRLGMDVSTVSRGQIASVGRIPDTGPVAWKDVALVVPVPSDGSVRVRLSFPADAWRIDRVAAGPARRVTPRVIPISEVLDANAGPAPGMASALAAPDARYLETTAGDKLSVRFRTGPDQAGTTWFLSWQGYYIEWMRRAWLAADRDSSAFVPNQDTMGQALARYRDSRDSTERRFYATRVPVR